MQLGDPRVTLVHGGAIEWTIKDGIPYHVLTLMKEVKDLVAKARVERARKQPNVRQVYCTSIVGPRKSVGETPSLEYTVPSAL